MSICCLWKGEVTFFPFILKMAASSADEMRDRGEHGDWLIAHNPDFCVIVERGQKMGSDGIIHCLGASINEKIFLYTWLTLIFVNADPWVAMRLNEHATPLVFL